MRRAPSGMNVAEERGEQPLTCHAIQQAGGRHIVDETGIGDSEQRDPGEHHRRDEGRCARHDFGDRARRGGEFLPGHHRNRSDRHGDVEHRGERHGGY